ncbi:MAG: hypothetical protein IJ335_04245 [Lachnospiraceae bacterium]|nr:hypothetical protein [Lachnospiraceae bacterium]
MNCVPGFAECTLLWKVAAGLFLFWLTRAALEDHRTGRVSNGIWLGAMLFWMPFALVASSDGFPLEPILFWMLQQILFSRFYGRADCHAFSCIGFYLWGMGLGLAAYLLYMLFTLLFMGAVQLLKGNVNREGNLRTPIPFLPYILLGFCGILVWIFR